MSSTCSPRCPRTARCARRIVGESFVSVYGYGDLGAQPRTEDDLPPLHEKDTDLRSIVEALRSLEQQLLSAGEQGLIEAVVLRYGMFYGPENPSTQSMLGMLRRRRLPLPRGAEDLAPFIHIDDAVSAAVAALERGRPGAIYNIVDDEPVSFSEFLRAAARAIGAPRPFTAPRWLIRMAAPMALTMSGTRLPVANARARRELSWRPQLPSYREGLLQVAHELESKEAVPPAVARSPQ
jgi:nucleoside-diphosphate-sugar epimerase